MLNGDSVNKVILMGRVANQPQWHLDEGVKTLYFNIITTEKIKRRGDLHEHEEWHRVRISERLVNPKAITSGRLVYVQGRLHTHQTIDGEGIKHYKAEIVACSAEVVDVKLQVV